MSYKVEYLPLALADLKDAVAHISDELGMPRAARELAETIIGDVASLSDFPYSRSAYTPIKPLKHDFRRLLVQNYSVFYWVDEDLKAVTVARILYNRRNFVALIR